MTEPQTSRPCAKGAQNPLRYIPDSIMNLNMKGFNKLEQFMLKLIRNNIFFKMSFAIRIITSIFNICLSCAQHIQNIKHFVCCNICETLQNTIVSQILDISLISDFPKELTFFFNDQENINHSSHVVYISTLHFIYSLRHSSTPPNLDLVKSNVAPITSLAVVMFPLEINWRLAFSMFKNIYKYV